MTDAFQQWGVVDLGTGTWYPHFPLEKIYFPFMDEREGKICDKVKFVILLDGMECHI